MNTLFATTVSNAKPKDRDYKLSDGRGLYWRDRLPTVSRKRSGKSPSEPNDQSYIAALTAGT